MHQSVIPLVVQLTYRARSQLLGVQYLVKIRGSDRDVDVLNLYVLSNMFCAKSLLDLYTYPPGLVLLAGRRISSPSRFGSPDSGPH